MKTERPMKVIDPKTFGINLGKQWIEQNNHQHGPITQVLDDLFVEENLYALQSQLQGVRGAGVELFAQVLRWAVAEASQSHPREVLKLVNERLKKLEAA